MILEGLVLWLGAKWLKGKLDELEWAPVPTSDPFIDLARKHGITHTDIHGKTHIWDGEQGGPRTININHQEQHIHLHQHHHYGRGEGFLDDDVARGQ